MAKARTGVALAFLLAIAGFFANANGAHEEAEPVDLGHQLDEMLPFHHLSEGHSFAAVLSVVLWASLFYALYSLYNAWKK
ncbi:MAG TPA: hypothetical protein VJA40_01430 [archaeon]|nr:hypothetical protein [archaeon]